MTLIIGNKTYSSWSLRPWILLKHFNIPFEEVLIRLDLPTTAAEIKKYSPNGKVPALVDNGFVVWESMAIMEYLNEKFPQFQMYPKDALHRARARSLCNEMHAGFGLLRQHLSFHAKKSVANFDHAPAQRDIDRVKNIWTECLENSSGPFLFGPFTIVDAMFAPVVGRFKTYMVPSEGRVLDYCAAINGLAAMTAWYEDARKEEFIAPDHE